YEPGAKHGMVGGEYHCIHGQGESTVFRIMEATRPMQLTLAMQWGPSLVWNTVTIEAVGAEQTKVVSRYHFAFQGEVTPEMRAFGVSELTKAENGMRAGITEAIENGAEAVAPA